LSAMSVLWVEAVWWVRSEGSYISSKPGIALIVGFVGRGGMVGAIRRIVHIIETRHRINCRFCGSRRYGGCDPKDRTYHRKPVSHYLQFKRGIIKDPGQRRETGIFSLRRAG
jgi:hypothetical protein